MDNLARDEEQALANEAEIHSIGIAISGGGLRAAFFSLGALMYVQHSGLHKRVRLISSVSGGSIVNIVVAMAGDFSASEPAKFGRLAGRVGARMATHGVFFWPGLRRLVGAIFGLALWAPLVMLGMNLTGHMNGWDWDFFWFGEVLYTGTMAAYLLAYLFLGRGHIQRSAYARFLEYIFAPQESRPRKYHRTSLSDLPSSTVTHVICATELTSGQPFYMSREMVLSPMYGKGRPKVGLSRAIYASAAFPIGFPPLRLRSSHLDLARGRDEETPKRLLLSDGGVFNNLGTETFSADSSAQVFLPDPSLPIIPQVDRQLVINASAPPRRAALRTIPIWQTFTCVARIMSVMYENTLRPRVQRLMEEETKPGGPIVVDISESPIELATRLSQGDSETSPARRRAAESRETLSQNRTDHEWKGYADRAARTKTVLSSIGKTAAVRLLRLGYLNTAIACHAHLGTQGVSLVPDDSWFSDLVDGKLTDEELVAPVSGYLAVGHG